MIIKFLSSISGSKPVEVLNRQRSSSSLASLKNSPKSDKHKPSATIQPVALKSSCIKSTLSQDGIIKNKKMSRVEFDFSYQKCNNIQQQHHQDVVRYCPKHNCCTQNISSSSSTTSTTLPIDIPQMMPLLEEMPSGVSKSFTIYETINRHNHRSSLPNCHAKSLKCESLANITAIPQTNISNKSTQVQCESSNKINLDNFKSAKRKVPIKNLLKISNLEIQAMKEKIAQAEVFLEAMGNAATTKNRDSSRYVRKFFLRFCLN